MEQKKQELEEYQELRRETRKFYGVEYCLILYAVKKDGVVEADREAVETEQWWCTDASEATRRLANYAARDFLWYDTRFMQTARMKDKYHYCELHAMNQITWLLDKYFWERTKWLGKEIKCYAYTVAKTFFPRLLFKLKKWFGKNEGIEINN